MDIPALMLFKMYVLLHNTYTTIKLDRLNNDPLLTC